MPTILQDPDFQSYVERDDPHAFRRLVERHLAAVQSTAARVLGMHSGWVDDVAQNVFLKLARRAKSLPSNLVLSAWLHRQTVRESIDLVRAEARRHRREIKADMTSGAEQEENRWNEIAPRLDREILRLPEQDRQVIALKFLERCNSEEIARRLGITSAAVRKRVERALSKLRLQLAGPAPTASLSVAALSDYLDTFSADVSAAKILAISSHSLAGATAAGGISGTFAALSLMTKTQTIGLAMFVAVGTGVFLVTQHDGAATSPELIAASDSSGSARSRDPLPVPAAKPPAAARDLNSVMDGPAPVVEERPEPIRSESTVVTSSTPDQAKAGGSSQRSGPGKQHVEEKLTLLILPKLELNNIMLDEALEILHQCSAEADGIEADPERRGVKFMLRLPQGEPSPLIRGLNLRNVPLGVAMKYLGEATRFGYTVTDEGVEVGPGK